MSFCQPRSLRLSRLLKAVRDCAFLSVFVSLDHSSGPKYLTECLPYLTVLKRGNRKSELRKFRMLTSFFMNKFAISILVQSHI